MFGWLMQRVSGIFLAYALVVHLWTVNVVNQGDLNWQTISVRLQEGNFWFIYYILFIPAVIYHAFNGLWSIFMDMILLHLYNGRQGGCFGLAESV